MVAQELTFPLIPRAAVIRGMRVLNLESHAPLSPQFYDLNLEPYALLSMSHIIIHVLNLEPRVILIITLQIILSRIINLKIIPLQLRLCGIQYCG